MNFATWQDLTLVIPELILVGTALVLIMAARRISSASWCTAVTFSAAIAAALAAAGWFRDAQTASGFVGMIEIDGYSQFFKFTICTALGICALLSRQQLDVDQVRPAELHALLLLAAVGMMLATSAVDLLTLYLGLEITTLCSYILVGITVRKASANEAAIKYFLLGSFASALFLYGMALTYGVFETTAFSTIARELSNSSVGQNRTLLLALVLLTAGLAFKVAAFPFHAWAPDAYQGASAPVAAFLASASKAAGIAALGRVCLSAFDWYRDVLPAMLGGIAALSIALASIVAVVQTDMKRLLAYSSIAHAGYALLGFVAAADGTTSGATATMTYVFLYVFMTMGAFAVVVGLGERGERIEGYEGLSAQRPAIALLMLLFLLSLTGIPPTAGFAAKFVVILSVIRAGFVWLAVLAVICTVITAYVYLRVAVMMYMKDPLQPAPQRFGWPLTAAIAIAAAVTLIGGVFPGSLTFWAVEP